MCGIVGYAGDRPAKDLLLEALGAVADAAQRAGRPERRDEALAVAQRVYSPLLDGALTDADRARLASAFAGVTAAGMASDGG